MSTLVALSAAVDRMAARHSQLGTAPRTHHGLGTLSWFEVSSITRWDPCFVAHSPTYTWQPATLPQQASGTESDSAALQDVHTLIPAAVSHPTVDFHALKMAANSGSPQRPVILLLHGFLGAASDWVPMMCALSATGFDCMALDLPGHGSTACGSGSSEDVPDIAGTADAVTSFVQAHGLAGRVVLVGYSLGARVALRVASTQPRLLKACMLISGTPGIKVRPPPACLMT